MKFILSLLLASLLVFTNSYSAPRVQNSISPKNVSYTLHLDEKIIDGKLYPSKSIDIEKLPKEYYYEGIIQIKTKEYQFFNPVKNVFSNENIQKSINYLGITSISNPYSDYFRGNQFLSKDKFGLSRIYEIRFSANENPFDICKELINNNEIEYATPLFKRYTYSLTPNDTWYNLQYHLQRINMQDAWEITSGDSTVVIAIVDSGTDINHEDLKANIWTNPKEIPNNNKDDDGNGKIDDVNGWDLIGNISEEDLYTGKYKENNNPINIINTHGTHTAGCAAATTNNSTGVASPAFNCRILPVKCASGSFQTPGISRGYDGILYAAVTGAKVINCSWGGPGWSPVEEDIVNQAINLGALIVAASGNSAKNLDIEKDYPAGFKGVLSVGSTGSTNDPSNFTSYGNLVRVYAPGENIWSTLPNNKYEAQSGTSMASPITAGLAALVFSIHKDWTPEQVIHQLRGSCDDVIVKNNPSLRYMFFGRINALKALQNNNISGMDMAGIGLESIKIKNNYLSDENFTDVTLKLKNYLAADNNIKVRLIPIDDYIEFEQNVYEVGKFESMESLDLITKARILPNNPWYKGYAEVIVEITGTNYINIETAKLNIIVPSTNRLFPLANVSSQYQIQWHSSTFISNNNALIVGVSPFIGGFAFKTGVGSNGFIQINQQPVYCMYAFDDFNFIAGDGPTSGLAQLHYSTNGGTSWTRKSVSHITPFVNSINFFSTNDGILLGDPIKGSWGVGITSDAGQTWALLQNLPAPLNNETGLVGSIFQKGDTISFGTTAGRIFRSFNKGGSWEISVVFQGGVVSSLSYNDSIAACIYGESNTQGAARFLATSKDGGKTWMARVYNFSANNQIPLDVYAIEDSKSIIVQLSNGKLIASDNDGIGWYPVLSEKKSDYLFSVSKQSGNKVSVFSAGTDITRLDFTYTPSVEKRILNLSGGNYLNFDTIGVNSIKDLTKDIKNIGNMPVSISSIEFIPDEGTANNEFILLPLVPKSVESGTPSVLRVRFAPKSIGMKSGEFRINSDAENSEIFLKVEGNSILTTDISDERLINLITLSPNPAKHDISITLSSDFNVYEFNIYNVSGELIINSDNFSLNSTINISELANGIYFIKFYTINGIITKQFIVAK